MVWTMEALNPGSEFQSALQARCRGGFKIRCMGAGEM